MLGHIGISTDLLSPIADPDQPYQAIDDRVARRWPHLAEAVWFPPIADGLASNIGLGAADGATVALTAATSGAMRTLVTGIPATVPTGLWCYRIDARRNLVGGALNDVGGSPRGSTRRWISGRRSRRHRRRPTLGHDAVDGALPHRRAQHRLGRSSPGPFANVTAASTGPLMHAAFEGVATSYRRIAGQLVEVSGTIGDRTSTAGTTAPTDPRRRWTAVRHPVLRHDPANALELPVIPVTTKRTTLRGTAPAALRPCPGSVPPPRISRRRSNPTRRRQRTTHGRRLCSTDSVTGQATEVRVHHGDIRVHHGDSGAGGPQPLNPSRSSRLSSLPLWLRGSSSTKRTDFGTLNGASRPLTRAMSSSPRHLLARLGHDDAVIASIHFSSGVLMTATSATAGWV